MTQLFDMALIERGARLRRPPHFDGTTLCEAVAGVMPCRAQPANDRSTASEHARC